MASAVRTLRSPSLSRLRKSDSKDKESKDSVKEKEVPSPRTRKESKEQRTRKDTGENTPSRLSLRQTRSTSSSNDVTGQAETPSNKSSTRRRTSGTYPAKREPIMDNHLRVLLPNKQKTMLKCEPGVTLEKALSKALQRRSLTVNVVKAYKYTPAKKLVAWDTLLTSLEKLEIVVEDRMSVVREHQFVNRGNMRITYCDVCHSLMVSGAWCSACGVKVHQRCIHKVLPAGLSCNPTGASHNNSVSSIISERKRPELCVSEAVLASFKDDTVLGPYFRNSAEKLKGTEVASISLEGSAIATLYSSSASHSTAASDDSDIGEDSGFEGRRNSSQRRRSTMDRWGSAPSLATTDAEASGAVPNVVISEDTPTDENGAGHCETEKDTPVATTTAGLSAANTPPPSSGSDQLHHRTDRAKPGPENAAGEDADPADFTWDLGKSTTLPHGATAHDVFRRSKPFEEPTWEINNDEVTIFEKIGGGAYGTVYRGEWHGCVAVKKMHMKNPTPEQVEIFRNEVQVLKYTRHSNILLFMGCILEPELAIVTQWCEGSNLFQHIHIRSTRFESKQIILIAKQVSHGMDYLHAKGIIHRDLKSANVLLEHERVPHGKPPPTINVKVADFGLSSLGGGARSRQTVMGSLLWMAPEIIRMDMADPYTAVSDVYAFGIILFELMTGSLPYTEIDNRDQILWMVGRGDLRPDINAARVRADLPVELKKIFRKCTAFSPKERANFMYVLDGLEHVHRAHINMPSRITRRNSLPNIPF